MLQKLLTPPNTSHAISLRYALKQSTYRIQCHSLCSQCRNFGLYTLSFLLRFSRQAYRLPRVFVLFRRARKIAKSDSELRRVCRSTSLSVRMKQLGLHWTDFNEIWYLSIFRKYLEKIHVSLDLTTITGALYEDLCMFMIKYLVNFFL
jgi:hypothetical protein